MLVTIFVFLYIFTFTKQENPPKCKDSVCIPYSECSEVHEMLKDDTLVNQARHLLCGYGHEPFVCCKRNCKTPNGNYGSIVHIDNCLHLKKHRYSSDRQKWNFLRESEVNRTHVCCKKGEAGYVEVPPAPIVQITKAACVTPNGEIGKCIEIEDCASYREVVGEVDERFRFINDSYCGWWKKPMICCGASHYYNEDYASNLPNTLDCGKWSPEDPQHGMPPWLALITPRSASGGCVGALISENYILSTTRCYTNFTDPSILIGDCITNPGLNQCIFKQSRVMAFPLHKYHKTEDTGMLLIKLNRPVQLPQAPICLPTSVLPLSIDIDILGVQQFASTWTPFQTTTISIENQICENEFKDSYINRIVCIENGICKEYQRNLLQYLVVQNDNDQWYLEGLINRDRCYGRDNNLFHAVSIYKFVPWIKSNIS